MSSLTSSSPDSSSHPSLAIRRGRRFKAQRLVLYSPEGFGKTTFASRFPSPVFIDTEEGSEGLDVDRFESTRDWTSIKQAVQDLTNRPHDFKTLVIDSVDWAEKFAIEDICRRNHKEGIEDFGYGRGYVFLAEEFSKFLRTLDLLRERGMHIVLLAHSTIRKFEQPDAAGAYDRYELKLSKQVAPLVKEWCDLLLFGNYFTRITESDTGRRRALGGKERVLYTSHCAAWDAKNRHGLDEKLPFDFATVAHIFQGASAALERAATAAPEPSLGEKLSRLFAGREDDVRAFLIARGQMRANGRWEELPADYAARVLADSDRFFQAVAEFTTGGAQ